jgi:hypothetical protein
MKKTPRLPLTGKKAMPMENNKCEPMVQKTHKDRKIPKLLSNTRQTPPYGIRARGFLFDTKRKIRKKTPQL